MANDFYKQLNIFTAKLEKSQSSRRKARIDTNHHNKSKDEDAVSLQGIALSPDVTALFSLLRQYVTAEKTRYALPVAETPITLNPEAPAPTDPAAALPPVAVVPSAFVQDFQAQLSTHLRTALPADIPEGLQPQIHRYIALLMEEMNQIANDAALLGSNGAVIIQRLNQARQAIFVGRMQDALTIMRTAYKAHPHSHLLLYLLSQFLYLLHALGQQGTLPEARELAQKSLIATDKVSSDLLLRYRVHAINTELGHDPERALNWMRETDLLNPAHLKGNNGLLGGHAMHLQAWAMLAHAPLRSWSETEFIRLHQLVHTVPGGAALYLFFFHNTLVAEAPTRKEPLPQLVAISQLILTAHQLYTDIATPMAQLTALPVGTLWTIRTRYARVVTAVAPVPAFDHVLLYIALDGHSARLGYPDQQLRAMLEDPHVSYWRLWLGCLSPDRETRLPHLLPIAETLEDHALLTEIAEVLAALRTMETKLVKPLWPDLQPWLPRWQMDHLLALGTGSNKPRSRFAPTLPPYSTYYRRWSEPTPSAVLPTDMIMENARRGGFASLFEAQAALEGGARLVLDPVHGLAAAQKRALAAARKANPAKFGKVGHDFGGGGATKGLLLLGLLGAGVGAAVHLTENIGQAIGLSLVLAGFVGILAVQMAKPNHA